MNLKQKYIPEKRIVKMKEIVYDESIYPRKEHSPKLVQQYAEDIEAILESEHFICLSYELKIIDGKHRWLAMRKAYEDDGDKEVPVWIYPHLDYNDLLSLAIELNSDHGYQLSRGDKKELARRLYGMGYSIETIAGKLAVTTKSIRNWLSDTLRNEREARNARIFDLWLGGHTQSEIAETMEIPQQTIADHVKVLTKMENFPNPVKLKALFQDEDFEKKVDNVWRYAKTSNEVKHFGHSEQRIVENLLEAYTKPFDMVVDPFAGGGSTIDVCKKRLRRYYVSDRKPIAEREHEIRKHDVVTEGIPPLHNRWNEVRVVYLDPPYWRQAAGEYSEDPTDLANMELESFTDVLVNFIADIGKRLQPGSVIALLMQPTQWRATNREYTDHVFDIVQGVKERSTTLKVENRISTPYSINLYLPQMIEWAKENHVFLVLTRELVIWKVIK